jgi:hypothetical protein
MKRPLIGLALSAVSFVLSLGLCGVGASTQHSDTQGTLVGLGLLFLVVGILGGFICLIWLLIVLVRGPR